MPFSRHNFSLKGSSEVLKGDAAVLAGISPFHGGCCAPAPPPGSAPPRRSASCSDMHGEHPAEMDFEQRGLYHTLLRQGEAGQSCGRGRTESCKAAGGEGFWGHGGKGPSSKVFTAFPAAVPQLLHPCGTVMEKITPNHLE